MREVIDLGLAEGSFTCVDPQASAVRLAALMDGLAVQVALRDPDVPEDRMTDLWLGSAAAELGIPVNQLVKAKRRAPAPRPKRS